jgi:hypothetical protein
MVYATDGDQKIEESKEIAEPQACADVRCVNQCVAECLEIVGLARHGHCGG